MPYIKKINKYANIHLRVLKSVHNQERLGLMAPLCLPGERPQGDHHPREKCFRKEMAVSTWAAAEQSFPPGAPVVLGEPDG